MLAEQAFAFLPVEVSGLDHLLVFDPPQLIVLELFDLRSQTLDLHPQGIDDRVSGFCFTLGRILAVAQRAYGFPQAFVVVEISSTLL